MQQVFIEKKEPFNIEAKKLLNEIHEQLNLKCVNSIRILTKYVVNNINEQLFKKTLKTVFSEPPVDIVYVNKFYKSTHEHAFAIAYLPGQFVQRADSAEQCIKLIDPKSQPSIKCATVYLINGSVNQVQLNKIKKYLINPVDSFETDVYDNLLFPTTSISNTIPIYKDFIKWKLEALEKFHHQQALAMSIDDLVLIQQYFIKEKRNPTETEIKVIDTYWSDHCRHTTFETKIENINIQPSQFTNPITDAYKNYLASRHFVYGKDTNRKISLMDLATINAKELRKKNKLKELVVSDENNACTLNVKVKIDKKLRDYLLLFKNETHNHPTEIEPFGGAATCLGGAIRDPLSGRAYVYQAMRVTGSADPTVPIANTLNNKLPQRTITTNAASGYSSYGNQIGLATGQVDEIYHPGYIAKRMEIGAVIAASPKSHVVRKTPATGDVIILLGGKTGKDGIGGATGSSKMHTTKTIHTGSAEVQKGNPICERKIQRLFRNPKASLLIKKCNDFGAGGVSVAIGELCPGLDINLDLIPKKYQNMTGTELAVSESQERMAVVVSKNKAKEFIALANQENLEATVVAKVTNTNYLKMYWKKQLIVNLSRHFLDTNGATQHAYATIDKINNNPFVNSLTQYTNIKSAWEQMLGNLNVCAKTGLVQKFDSTIGSGTVLSPLGGKWQLTPAEGMAALIPSFEKNQSETTSLMAYGFNPYLGVWSPFHMAYYAVLESVTKIVAMGGKWNKIYLSLQEYFEKLQKNESKWGKPLAALLGAYQIQKDLGIAAVGGKDSMSGSYENLHVPPTLVSFAVTTEDVKNIISPEFKKTNSTIILITPKRLSNYTIDIKTLKDNFAVVQKNIANKKIISAYSLKQFGIAEGFSKMCMGNRIGCELINIDGKELFNINYGSLLLEVVHGTDIKKTFKGSNYKIIGKTNNSSEITCSKLNFSLPIEQIIQISQHTLNNVFPYQTNHCSQNVSLPNFANTKRLVSKKIVKQPLVVIPVFPGTNCEYDTQYAFERAGAKVQQILICNMDEKSLLSSINKLAQAINKAHILMLPGGFSAADEPEGSAKFIVNIFHNSAIEKAVNKLLKNDGLILGICNGFQALIKLGLLHTNHIQDSAHDSPTLTFNKVNHHMSSIVKTKVISNKSPWLAKIKLNEVRNVAISHGEGQLIVNEHLMKEMVKQGQIATQYVDLNNNPTMNMPYNPNGSTYAIEGITNVDGHIFGKMGHVERIGKNLYKNIIGDYDMKIFESGVTYFTHKMKE